MIRTHKLLEGAVDGITTVFQFLLGYASEGNHLEVKQCFADSALITATRRLLNAKSSEDVLSEHSHRGVQAGLEFSLENGDSRWWRVAVRPHEVR